MSATKAELLADALNASREVEELAATARGIGFLPADALTPEEREWLRDVYRSKKYFFQNDEKSKRLQEADLYKWRKSC